VEGWEGFKAISYLGNFGQKKGWARFLRTWLGEILGWGKELEKPFIRGGKKGLGFWFL